MSGARIAILARLDPSVAGLGRAGRLAGVLEGAGHDVTVVALGPRGERTEEGRRTVLVPPEPGTGGKIRGWLLADPGVGAAAAALAPDLVIATDPVTLRQAVAVDGAAVLYDSWEVYVDQVEQTVPRRWFRPVLVPLLRRQVRREERRCLPRTAGVVFTSEGHRELFAARHRRVMPARTALVRNCPPYSEPRPDPYLRAATGAGEGERLLVYAGSLAPSRGLLPMLEAVRRLGAGYRLAVLGWGWLEAEMRRRAPENATILGPVAVNRLVDVLSGGDVGLLPIEAGNASKRHSLANKLFEYLMAGLPVVATDLPGHRRVLGGTRAGVLVPRATPDAIAAGVREILAEDPAPRRREARRLARERYSLEREAPALLGIVDAALATSAGPRKPGRTGSRPPSSSS